MINNEIMYKGSIDIDLALFFLFKIASFPVGFFSLFLHIYLLWCVMFKFYM